VKHRILQILWPAFLVAAVMEILLFSTVDPVEIRWFGRLIGWLTVLLRLTADELDPPKGSPPRF
jgi:hypothetical protein